MPWLLRRSLPAQRVCGVIRNLSDADRSKEGEYICRHVGCDFCFPHRQRRLNHEVKHECKCMVGMCMRSHTAIGNVLQNAKSTDIIGDAVLDAYFSDFVDGIMTMGLCEEAFGLVSVWSSLLEGVSVEGTRRHEHFNWAKLHTRVELTSTSTTSSADTTSSSSDETSSASKTSSTSESMDGECVGGGDSMKLSAVRVVQACLDQGGILARFVKHLLCDERNTELRNSMNVKRTPMANDKLERVQAYLSRPVLPDYTRQTIFDWEGGQFTKEELMDRFLTHLEAEGLLRVSPSETRMVLVDKVKEPVPVQWMCCTYRQAYAIFLKHFNGASKVTLRQGSTTTYARKERPQRRLSSGHVHFLPIHEGAVSRVKEKNDRVIVVSARSTTQINIAATMDSLAESNRDFLEIADECEPATPLSGNRSVDENEADESDDGNKSDESDDDECNSDTGDPEGESFLSFTTFRKALPSNILPRPSTKAFEFGCDVCYSFGSMKRAVQRATGWCGEECCDVLHSDCNGCKKNWQCFKALVVAVTSASSAFDHRWIEQYWKEVFPDGSVNRSGRGRTKCSCKLKRKPRLKLAGSDTYLNVSMKEIFARVLANKIRYHAHNVIVDAQRICVAGFVDDLATNANACCIYIDFTPLRKHFRPMYTQSQMKQAQYQMHVVVLRFRKEGAREDTFKTFLYIADSSNDFSFVRWSMEQGRLLQEMSNFTDITIISDGTSKHYKSGFTLRYVLVRWRELAGADTVRWIFHASCHGKNCCDAVSGIVKSYLAKKCIEEETELSGAYDIIKELTSRFRCYAAVGTNATIRQMCRHGFGPTKIAATAETGFSVVDCGDNKREKVTRNGKHVPRSEMNAENVTLLHCFENKGNGVHAKRFHGDEDMQVFWFKRFDSEWAACKNGCIKRTRHVETPVALVTDRTHTHLGDSESGSSSLDAQVPEKRPKSRIVPAQNGPKKGQKRKIKVKKVKK